MTFEPIAIVGRSCVLPGANDIATFSDNLRSGRDFVTAVTPGRWRLAPRYALGESGRDCAWSSHGGYVTGFEEVFDPSGYNLPAEILAGLDPVFQWPLHTANLAMKEAGIEPGPDVAVVLGNLSFPSEGMTRLGERIWLEKNAVALGIDPGELGVDHPHPWNRFSSGLPAHVVSQALGLGEAFALDAACATSLYALQLAAEKLARGEARAVLAGAVNRADSLFLHVGFCALNALSPSGRSRPFHSEADGLIPAEGGAFVALKRLRDAEADGDQIYGVIRGVGLSNDGRGRGFLAPSQDGQERAIRAAYASSGVDPGDLEYVECHATGTSLGDATELGSMRRVWNDGLMVGSHKSNFGHAITVAGMSGLLKVLDAFEDGAIAPTLHCDNPIDLARGPFDLITESRPWDGRFAGVNAFGFGGNNAHIILERPGFDAAVIPAPAPREPIAIVGSWMRVGDLEGTDAVFGAFLRNQTPDLEMSQVSVELAGLRFPPRDLSQTLGQQLAVMEGARRVVAEGGIEGVDADRVSVFVGMGVDTEIVRYGGRWRMAQWGDELGFDDDWIAAARDSFKEVLAAEGVVGSMPNIPANRINSQLDVRGPSFTVSGEEASGLRALEIARNWLQDGLIDAALVGASELACEPVHEAIMEELVGERPAADASVVLVLRRLDDARAQGLDVLAVFDDQEGWKFDNDRSRETLGYPHAAEGLLDVALAAQCCARGVRPRPGGVAIWMTDHVDAPRSATVTSDALGGQHAAVSLRSDRPPTGLPVAQKRQIYVVEGENLPEVLGRLRAGVFADRPQQRCRLAIVSTPAHLAQRVEEAIGLLEQGRTFSDGIYYRDDELPGELAFVFTGSGAAYAGMGAGLVGHAPDLATRLAEKLDVDPHFASQAAWVYERSAPELGDQAESQIWATSWLSQLHALLSRDVLDLSPTAAIGLSLGESSALFSLGAWNDFGQMIEDLPKTKIFSSELAGDFAAVREAWASAGHIDAATAQSAVWENWSLFGDIDKVRSALEGEDLCHITTLNADDECVIGGSPEACERVLTQLLNDTKLQATPLSQKLAVHAPEVERVAEAYRDLHTRPTQPVEGIRFYSNASNTHYAPTEQACADAIVGQAIAPIDFPTTIRNAYADGVRIFIEHGPRGACTSWIKRILGDREHLAIALDRPGTAPDAAILNACAQLLLVGVDVNWRAFTEMLVEQKVPTMGKSLSFPAHAAPVELRRADVFVMPAAPATPFSSAASVEVAIPAAPQPAAAPAMPVGAPPTLGVPAPVPMPAVGYGGPYGTALDFQRQVTELHTGFVAQQAAVHHQFLAFQQESVRQLASAYANGGAIVAQPAFTAFGAPAPVPAPLAPPMPSVAPIAAPVASPTAAPAAVVAAAPAPAPAPATPAKPRVEVLPAAQPRPPRSELTLSRGDLEFLSHGPISELFGPEFKDQDQYDVVVRMPMPPLLLADRITELDAEPATMKAGRIVSETDVCEDSWYLYNGHMPAGIMIESGQADLLLVSYLGVDLLNKGERVYRLLGCKLTYRGPLPEVGETLRYDIEIDGFAKHGDVRLFFFHYDCTVAGGLRLQVRGGQAGFFTYDELDDSGGILWTPEEGEYNIDAKVDEPVARTSKSVLTKEDLVAFSEGRPWETFGPDWELTKAHLRTPCISGGRMMFLDRVTNLEYRGGPWERGYLRAEADITPDHWFFEGHFFNDPCMPGTLMFEAALQAMTVYMVANGVTIDRDAWRFQPVQDVEYDMRCRGQVDPESKLTVYEIFVEGFDDGSEDGIPKLFADMLVTVDGLGAFWCRGMGLELVPDYPQQKLDQPLVPGRTPLANEDQVRAIQLGRPSDAFGEMYKPYDGPRNVPRLPGPPYDLVSRVLSATGHMSLQTGSEIVVEYDVPPDAWYFEEGDGEMPYGVLLEAALQPCGWLASWVGCAAQTDCDVFFRNLDGTGTLHRSVTPADEVLTTTATLTKYSKSGPMTIVGFDVDTRSGDEPIYTMETVFGFFPAEALASQAGITDNPPDLARVDSETQIGQVGMLGLLSRVTHKSEEGGIHGAGRIVAEMDVDAGEWFFKAHFFSDPVQPGSLGLQLMLDALSLFGDERRAGAPISGGGTHTWKYRGQVRPWKKQVVVDVHRRPGGLADAWLWTDGECIYRFEGFGLG